MEWVEVPAKSVAEAKDRALDLLGVDESQAEFEVLEEPRTGLFGRLKGEARVRARIKPTQPRPKAERRDRKRKPREGGRGDERSGRDRPQNSSRRGDDRRDGGDRADGRPTTTDEADPGDRSETRRPANRPAKNAEAPTGGVTREEANNAMAEESTTAPTDDGRQTEHAVDFLTGLVGAFGLDATVQSVSVDETYDEVQVNGKDLGILIGPRAGSLDSIQELTRVVAQRRSGGRGESRLRVDIAGYRQRRREALERFAIRLAEEVKATGTVKALEPMNSADRKVVHDVVGAMDGVSTLSEGEDPRRRVVIVPRS